MIDLAVRHVLPGLDLDVAFEAPGGVTSIFGPSGAGKTSLLRAVAGIAPSAEVRLSLNGADLGTVPTRARRIGYVFQDARLFPHMTVRRNLRYGGRHDEARVIEMLGLGDLLDRKPRALSGGEAQRVAIGRALMSDPQMLLLDEPLSSLDGARKTAILPYLERLRDEVGIPILHVSHDLSEVIRLADTLVLLSEGKVIKSGDLGDLLRDHKVAEYLPPRQRGTLMSTIIDAYDADDDLTRLVSPGGLLLVPGQLGAVGAVARIRILAHDMILTRAQPVQVSALNVLKVTVQAIEVAAGGVDVTLDWCGQSLLARVTKRSATALEIAPGQALYAMVKASAVGAG